jgi:hypothetical protein
VLAALAVLSATTLVAGQLLLPGIARERLTDRLEARGASVDSIAISAWPAAELLLGRADDVDLDLSSYTLARDGGHDTGEALTKADRINAEIDHMSSQRLRADDVRFAKDGSSFHASLRLDADGLRPQVGDQSVKLTPVVHPDGSLELRAGDSGVAFSMVARDGKLALEPEGDGLLSALVPARELPSPDALHIEQVRASRTGDGVTLSLAGAVAT